jgi:putative salt-induced outer membrane protein YdiY
MKIRMTVAACVAVAMAGVAGAQDPAAAKNERSFNAGLSLTDGNSETLAANASLLAEGEKQGFGSYRVGLEGNYGESTVNEVSSTTVGNAKGYGNARRMLNDRLYASLDAVAIYDDISEIDYRVTVGPGIGVYLVKNERVSLSFEAGPSYVWEEVGDVEDDYLALRAAQRLDVKFNAGAKMWESVEYLPDTADFNSYLINAELGVETTVTEGIVLRVVVQNKYDSEPAAGREQNDLSLVSSLGVKF